jgi:hypothetical protein
MDKTSVLAQSPEKCPATAWAQTDSSPAPTAKMFIAIADQGQHAIPSTAVFSVTIPSFHPVLAALPRTGMLLVRALPMEQCHATEKARMDSSLAPTVSTITEIVHLEPLA